ncbi:flagellar protein FliT [Paenibacillus sp. IHBB 10380]|uniref:flagellar protein FliT n=1 Tax=Paenibacillus sp. IHBB 10380 TaxID=1566358 RepID=UPI0005CFA902|nr:flagellar protein FliT [Paenibacillus sp. IHBB 10380]AJS60363.1 hypothetical protein UB51_20065 [Paenibacillus sp. IHBB 10380]
MDETIEELNNLTNEMINTVDECSYEEMELFVDVRQKLVDRLNNLKADHVLTNAQRVKIQQILKSNELIMARMLVLKNEAQDWLLQRSQSKAQRNGYETAYSPDSILMDRRK